MQERISNMIAKLQVYSRTFLYASAYNQFMNVLEVTRRLKNLRNEFSINVIEKVLFECSESSNKDVIYKRSKN